MTKKERLKNLLKMQKVFRNFVHRHEIEFAQDIFEDLKLWLKAYKEVC